VHRAGPRSREWVREHAGVGAGKLRQEAGNPHQRDKAGGFRCISNASLTHHWRIHSGSVMHHTSVASHYHCNCSKILHQYDSMAWTSLRMYIPIQRTKSILLTFQSCTIERDLSRIHYHIF
jgi:hypothetical protein